MTLSEPRRGIGSRDHWDPPLARDAGLELAGGEKKTAPFFDEPQRNGVGAQGLIPGPHTLVPQMCGNESFGWWGSPHGTTWAPRIGSWAAPLAKRCEYGC